MLGYMEKRNQDFRGNSNCSSMPLEMGNHSGLCRWAQGNHVTPLNACRRDRRARVKVILGERPPQLLLALTVEGSGTKECRPPLELGKGRGICLWSLHKGTQPSWLLDFRPVKPISDFWLQGLQYMRCFQPLSLYVSQQQWETNIAVMSTTETSLNETEHTWEKVGAVSCTSCDYVVSVIMKTWGQMKTMWIWEADGLVRTKRNHVAKEVISHLLCRSSNCSLFTFESLSLKIQKSCSSFEEIISKDKAVQGNVNYKFPFQNAQWKISLERSCYLYHYVWKNL